MEGNDGVEKVLEKNSTQTTTSTGDTNLLPEKQAQSPVSNFDAESLDTGSVVANTEEIALKALHVDDDPSLNPWTLRVFILG